MFSRMRSSSRLISSSAIWISCWRAWYSRFVFTSMVWSRNFERRARIAARSLSSVRRSVSLCDLLLAGGGQRRLGGGQLRVEAGDPLRRGRDEPPRLLGGRIELLEGDEMVQVLGHF